MAIISMRRKLWFPLPFKKQILQSQISKNIYADKYFGIFIFKIQRQILINWRRGPFLENSCQSINITKIWVHLCLHSTFRFHIFNILCSHNLQLLLCCFVSRLLDDVNSILNTKETTKNMNRSNLEHLPKDFSQEENYFYECK